MIIDNDTTPVRQREDVVIRPFRPEDRKAVRRVVRSAYAEYAARMPRATYRRYLADLLALDRHEHFGRLLVAEVDGRICGSVAFYPDASLQGLGWPRGWAGGRALAVHRRARHLGVATALMERCEELARAGEAPVFAFHTAPFMTGAIALYEGLGYHRAPEYDRDVAALFGDADSEEIRILGFAKFLF
jgi:predicted N-acetyltransferase YhbS